jgi:hypothetical protein
MEGLAVISRLALATGADVDGRIVSDFQAGFGDWSGYSR